MTKDKITCRLNAIDNLRFVQKTDNFLGWMNVDINTRRIDLKNNDSVKKLIELPTCMLI